MKNNNDLSKFENIMINIITTIIMLLILAVICTAVWFFFYGLWHLIF
ncbi:hypothetical protein [Staphylococcus sp. LKG3-3]